MSIRKNIYYWKSDRPDAFLHLRSSSESNYTSQTENDVHRIMQSFFGTDLFDLEAAGGQGNHLTYLVKFGPASFFLRLDNEDEKDDYMLIESEILKLVKAKGVSVPFIYKVDTSHSFVPFSYQIMEYISYPDLNKIKKSGDLKVLKIAYEVGRNIALWQQIKTEKFGLFNSGLYAQTGKLIGCHDNYKDYYFLNLETHLNFLKNQSFLSVSESDNILKVIQANDHYLNLENPCLVHKDLALWNLLGTEDEVKAVIDWGDAISGDPTDDISLYACFHSKEELNELLKGYQIIHKLPPDFYPRFYLHFLRNMLVKAVIRVGGGYFEKSEDFFLVDSDMKGNTLEEFTHSRIIIACQNLSENLQKISI